MEKFPEYARHTRGLSKENQKIIHVTHCRRLVSVYHEYLIQHLKEHYFMDVTKFIVSVVKEYEMDEYKAVMGHLSHQDTEWVVRFGPSMNLNVSVRQFNFYGKEKWRFHGMG